MKDTRTYSLFPSNLDLVKAFQGMLDHLHRTGFTENTKSSCERVSFWLYLQDHRNLWTEQFDEFLLLLKEYPKPESLKTHSHWKAGKDDVALDIDMNSSRLEIGVKGDPNVILALHEKAREVFSASNPETKKSPLLNLFNLKKTAFLAHRFDKQGQQASSTLSKFLRLLGYHILEGEGYEARDIPAKVSERIQAQDIFLLTATPGDASWILSEASYAKGIGKYIIVLLQEGVQMNMGIIGGDFERISFPDGCIEKAFCDLLYALPR